MFPQTKGISLKIHLLQDFIFKGLESLQTKYIPRTTMETSSLHSVQVASSVALKDEENMIGMPETACL